MAMTIKLEKVLTYHDWLQSVKSNDTLITCSYEIVTDEDHYTSLQQYLCQLKLAG